MPEKKVRKITDRGIFSSVFNKLFLNKKVLLRKEKETIPVTYLRYDNGLSILQIPDGHSPFHDIIIYVERPTDIVFSHMTFRENLGEEKYSFDTIDIQIMEHPPVKETKPVENEVRHEKRIGQLHISDIISDFSLNECLKNNHRRVEFLREELQKKLTSLYPYTSVVFIHDKKPNPRMEYFQNERSPYFFPEIKRPEKPADNPALFNFITHIYSKDLYLSEKKLTSELCVPLLYKFMLPFGYIQVNSATPLTEKDYSAIRKLGMSASVIFTNDATIIRSAEDIIPIADLSQKGLGILFKDKPLIKHFKDKSNIVFNIYFPDNQKASVLANVKHINLVDNKFYRVGTEILNIDPIGEVYYQDYIDSMSGNGSK